MLQAFLKTLIRRGRLSVHIGRKAWSFGEAQPPPGLDVAFRLKNGWTAWRIASNPYLHFGEAYTDGDLVMERGSLWDLMTVIGVNLRHAAPRRRGLARLFDRLRPGISPRAARRNVAHHYDLSEQLYRLFLDKDLQYSCAYFERPGASLEQAQLAKKDHIAAKLALRPRMRVLDIGCGWGGLALHLAGRSGAEVTGLTLSGEQFEVARRRAAQAGEEENVAFELCDYRDMRGTFDRVVSVGMFEHVGLANYDTYFQTVADRLKDDGVALIHTIGRRGENGARSQWLDTYIFPGGYLPSLSEIVRAAEKAGLWITDVESLRLHYAETLKAWRERFLANRAEAAALYDERFCRMWEFYLAFCELGFRYGDLMVFQVQLAKRVDALPITRDYMMAPQASSAVVDMKERAGKVLKGVPGGAAAARQGETRRKERDGAPRVETR